MRIQNPNKNNFVLTKISRVENICHVHKYKCSRHTSLFRTDVAVNLENTLLPTVSKQKFELENISSNKSRLDVIRIVNTNVKCNCFPQGHQQKIFSSLQYKCLQNVCVFTSETCSKKLKLTSWKTQFAIVCYQISMILFKYDPYYVTQIHFSS